MRNSDKKKKVNIEGKDYVYIDDFAERVGVVRNTVYQWRSGGRLSKFNFVKSYLGNLIFEEKAIEPFKRSLLENVTVYR